MLVGAGRARRPAASGRCAARRRPCRRACRPLVGEGGDDLVGHLGANPLDRVRRIEVADPPADLDHAVRSNGCRPICTARVVELGARVELVQALRQRGRALDALGAVEEGRGAGDQHVEAGVAPAVQVVDELAQRVEALLAAVARTRWMVSTSSSTSTSPLRPVCRSTSSRPRRKPAAPSWSRSPLMPAARLIGGADVGLAHQPGDEALLRRRARRGCAPRGTRATPPRTAAGSRSPRPGASPAARRRPARTPRRCPASTVAAVDDLLLELKNQRSIRRANAPSVHSAVCRPSIARRYTVSSLYSGVSVSEIWTRVVAKPRSRARCSSQREKKVLPVPYSPRTALNRPRARGHRFELLVDGLLEAVEPHGEQLEPAPGHRADAQRIDDLAALERAGFARWFLQTTAQPRRSSQASPRPG